MNSDKQDFWSKPRNRWMVFIVSALSVFGGYVIATPVSRNSIPLIVESKPIQIDKEIVQPEKEPVREPNPDESVLAATISTPSKSLIKTKSKERTIPPPDFRLSDRNYSDPEKAAIYSNLVKANEKTEFPYEFDKELYELSEKVKNGTATPSESNRYLLLGSRPLKLRKEYEKKPEVPVGPDKSLSEKIRKATSNARWSSPQGLTSDQMEAVRDAVEDKQKDSDSEESFKSGQAASFTPRKYVPHEKEKLSEDLEKTHRNLKIYSVIAGMNASAMTSKLALYTKKSKVVYTELEKTGVELGMHERYRIGPDFDNHFEFEGTDEQKLAAASQASDSLMFTLGLRGQIVFEVTNGEIQDGEGVDFVIWSNPFCSVIDPKAIEEMKKELRKYFDDFIPFSSSTKQVIDKNVVCYEDLATVEVSQDSAKGPWKRMDPCFVGGNKASSQCTGYGMNLWNQNQNPFNAGSGGDRYDIAQTSYSHIKAIRITDLANPTTKVPDSPVEVIENGYDLDAIAMLHYQETKIPKGSKQ